MLELPEVVAHIVANPGMEWVGLAHRSSLTEATVEAARLLPGSVVDVSTFALGHRAASAFAAIGVARVFVSSAVIKMPGSFERAKITAALGDKLRMSRTHAKFSLIRAPERSISIVSSANASKNMRWEHYFITDNPEVSDLLAAHLAELEDLGAECFRESCYYSATYQRAMSGKLLIDLSVSLEDLIANM